MFRNRIAILFMFMLTSIVAVVGVCDGLGLGIDPFLVFAGLLAVAVLLVVTVRYPAALITPMLFTPQYKDLPILSRYPATLPITALTATATLLGLAMCIRLAQFSMHGGDFGRPFRGARKWIKAYLLFAGIVALSYLYTTAPNFGADKLLRFLAFGSMAFFAPFVLLRTDEDFRDLVVGTVLFALPVAAYSIQLAGHGPSGTGSNPVHIGIGQLIGMAILLLLYSGIANPRLRAAVLFVGIPVLVLGLIAAVVRGPLLGVVLVLGLGLFLPSLKPTMVSRKMVVLSLAAATMAILVLASGLFGERAGVRLKQKIAETEDLVAGSHVVQGSGVQRLALYKDAWQGIQQRPILGWGVGGWIMFFNHTDTLDLPRPPEEHFRSGHLHSEHYPHNLFLEVGMEQGLLGLAALLFFLGGIFTTLGKSREAIASRFPYLLPVCIYLLLITQVSGEIVDNRFLWFWCGVVLVGCQLAEAEAVEDTLVAEPEWEGPSGESTPALEGL